MELRKKQIVLRVLAGAILGAVLAPLVGAWLSSMTLRAAGENLAQWCVTPEMWKAFGSEWLALGAECLLGALCGAVVMLATLPFADSGRALLSQSFCHLAATELAFALLLWVCRWVQHLSGLVLWGAVLAVVYLLIWLGRWIGWYQDVVQLRRLLGLAPGPSPLHWRETLPYLPFALLVCNVLPAVLMWIDLTFVVDVPVFSGLLYPYLALPAVAFCSGLSLGRRQGRCWLYPLGLLLLYLPTVFLLYNSSALFHCLMASVPALAGMLLGSLTRKKQ